MKKILKAIFTGLILFSAVSCASNNTVETTSPDSYEAESTKITISSDAENTDSEAVEETKSTKTTKTVTKSKGLTFGNKDKYLEYDNSSVFVKEIPNLKEKEATFVMRVDNGMVGWGSAYMGAYYYVLFDETARATLFKAMNSYLSDFENKNLKPKAKNTSKTYGKVMYRLDWGTLSSSTPNHGTDYGYCGYEFEKGSPYFTISNYPFTNDYYEIVRDATSKTSMGLTYYFTRAQIKKLMQIMSEENILEEFGDLNEQEEVQQTEADVY